MNNIEREVKEEMLKTYRMFLDMIAKYPINIIQNVLGDKIKQYEKELKNE